MSRLHLKQNSSDAHDDPDGNGVGREPVGRAKGRHESVGADMATMKELFRKGRSCFKDARTKMRHSSVLAYFMKSSIDPISA